MLTKPSDAAVGGEPLLVAVAPSGAARQVRFTSALVGIGRDADADLCIADDSVSRRHAEVRLVPLAVRDLGSRNGTRVLGEVVGDAWVSLSIGSVIEIGDAVVFVRSSLAADDAMPVPSKRSERAAPVAARVIADPAMVHLYELIELVAPSRLSVLVLGETGAGKEVVARALHAASPRRDARMLALNCAAIAPSLLESELFGYVKGAFTGAAATKPGLFEAASGGTVFLDEVGEMPLELQAKLLRVLETGEVIRLGAVEPITVDVRFVAATHQDLARMCERGAFRLDLLYRISGVTLAVPPLRERPADVEPLARHFLRELRGGDGDGLTAAALAALRRHGWPGNVRELRSTIERADLLSRGAPIDVAHLTFGVGVALGAAPAPAAPRAFKEEVADLERARILAALDACGGNQTRAARSLQMSRATLVRRLEEYGVARPRK